MKKPAYAINEYIKKYRKLANISQLDLGKKLGFSSGQYVSNWERHVPGAKPSNKNLKKMVIFLDFY